MKGMVGFPPDLTIGQGGPAQTELAHELRVQRDAIHAQLDVLRGKIQATPEREREALNNEYGALAGKATELSREIYLAECAAKGSS